MGIELELIVLLVLSNLGQILFGRFEIETERWRLILKWTLVHSLTLGLFFLIGHWALLVPLVAGGGGLIFHTSWCLKHGIHPLRATPLDKYYQLRGWSLTVGDG
jgi:hypothetical protein